MGTSLNWRRGLLRGWLAISFLWLLIIAALSLDIFLSPLPFRGDYQYVAQTKEMPWNIDWSKPFYETYYSPGNGPFPDRFADVPAHLVESWDARVKSGTLTAINFPDRSKLYLSSEMTLGDQEYVSRVFWDQRFSRYWGIIWPWLTGAFGPPLVLLGSGAACYWVIAGFRKA